MKNNILVELNSVTFLNFQGSTLTVSEPQQIWNNYVTALLFVVAIFRQQLIIKFTLKCKILMMSCLTPSLKCVDNITLKCVEKYNEMFICNLIDSNFCFAVFKMYFQRSYSVVVHINTGKKVKLQAQFSLFITMIFMVLSYGLILIDVIKQYYMYIW